MTGASASGRRVLIVVNGSHRIGLGHVYRMITLATALRRMGLRILLAVQEDAPTQKLLRGAGLDHRHFPPTSRTRALKRAVLEFRPDVIVHDVLATDMKDLAGLRRLSRARLVHFDDPGAGLKAADVVINALCFHWGRYRAGDCRARLYEGPRYMILHPAIRGHIRRRRRTPAKARKILLAFGGTDTHHLTERVMRALNEVKAPMDVAVNIGPGYRMPPAFERHLQSSPHRTRILRGVPDLFAEFEKADLVIAAGGIMLYELAAMGVPSVSIPAEPHEIANASYWARAGSTVALEWEKRLKTSRITQVVSRLRGDAPRRSRMSAAGRRSMDTLGLKRVVKIVTEGLS
jgi:UDP-2,4-diacetamido-2,4,6-trideoxy-beta-L-altropyranose hydrolase